MRRSVGLGALLSALLVVACGDDGSDPGRDSPNDDAGSVDGGELDGGLDASHTLDANIGDSATKPDATYFVNDAGETVQECAKSSQCPTGYRCEQDGARKACEATTGFGMSCSGDADCAGTDAPACVATSGSNKSCVLRGCGEQPGLCPSGLICCGDPALSFCMLACNATLPPIPE